MNRRHVRIGLPVIVCVAGLFAGLAIAASRDASNRRAVIAPDPQEFLFSATEIILLPGGNLEFDSDIARLDTRTGAVYRFRGEVNNPSTRNSWELRVGPVKGETSGLLEIQQVRPFKRANRHDPRQEPLVTFLVDIVTGNTWILRERASTNASWDPVDVFGQRSTG